MAEIHIIAPVTTPGMRNLADIAHLERPDLRFSLSILDKGPASIESEYDEALSVPAIIARAVEAERNGADAVVIDCMGDPGVKPAREMVKIPVLGPAEYAMHLAATMGQSFSIVTVLNSVVPMLKNLARVYGVSEKLASVLAVDMPVLEIEERLDEARCRLAETSLLAVERDGADVIILGCTGFFGCADAISTHLAAAGHDIPVIDPIPATVCMADAMIRAGLRHSKKTYAYPRGKPLMGYEMLHPAD